MTTKHAFIAANRFGFGPWPGQLRKIAPDPKGWLLNQLNASATAYDDLENMPDTKQALEMTRASLERLKKLKDRAEGTSGGKTTQAAILRELRDSTQQPREALMQEIFLRTRIAVQSRTPMLERLVHFWSNHFTVSVTRKEVAGVAGAFERDAIRPHVLGNFTDMMLAVARHPAMLFYLDNIRSIGPNSPAGRRRGKGLNENLAREILELHTLGVDGGYTQHDVEQFARMLTGWTIEAELPERAQKQLKRFFKNGVPPGTIIDNGFQYQPLLHEPGPKTLLGKTYRENGYHEAEQAIRDLCAHKSTARFIATKLARHFIADDPPDEAVNRLAREFSRTNGDLKAVTKALINLPHVWGQTLPKVKTPNDLVISTLRAVGLNLSARELAGIFKNFNQMPFEAQSPAGWADAAKYWIGPEAMTRRIEWAQLVATRASRRIDVGPLAADILGPVLSSNTRTEISRAPDLVSGLMLVLTSPEFQRR